MGARKGKRKHSRRRAPAPGRDRAGAATRSGDPGRPGRSRPDPGSERPDPPWGSLPLSELLVLSGIAFLVWGLAGELATPFAVGLGLASLGGLEITVREHLSGFRSHTTLLAGAVTLAVMAGTYYLSDLEAWIALALGAVAFAASFVLWRRAFRTASGGYSFRIGGFKG